MLNVVKRCARECSRAKRRSGSEHPKVHSARNLMRRWYSDAPVTGAASGSGSVPFSNVEPPATGGGDYKKLGYKPGSEADPWGAGNITIHAWNRRLLDLVDAGKIDEAKDVFKKMIDGEGPAPNIPTYHIMSNMFRKIPDYDAVKNLERMMNEAVRVRSKPKSKSTPARPSTREYHPKYRTGPWALLLALYRNSKPEGLPKEELVELAAPFSDFSFTEPTDYHGFYTAWASMGTLINKGLVERSRHGAAKEQSTLYILTEEGRKLGEMLDAEEKDPTSAAVHAMQKEIASSPILSSADSSISPSNWFTSELRQKLVGKIGLTEEEATALQNELDKSKLSSEDARKKQLATIVLALFKKGGQKAIDGAVRRSKQPAEVLDMVATLRSTDLIPQAQQ